MSNAPLRPPQPAATRLPLRAVAGRLLFSLLLALTAPPRPAVAQHRSDSTFSALEERCTTLPDGSSDCYAPGGPAAGLHRSTLSFAGDSVFLTQTPVALAGADTLESPADASAFWKGTLERRDGTVYLSLQLFFCIGCPMNLQRDASGKWVSAAGTKTYTGFATALGLRLNGLLFRKEE